MNSISYLALLEILIPTGDGVHKIAIDPVLQDNLVTFLVTFDPRQIRFIGNSFTNVFALVGTGQLLPV